MKGEARHPGFDLSGKWRRIVNPRETFAGRLLIPSKARTPRSTKLVLIYRTSSLALALLPAFLTRWHLAPCSPSCASCHADAFRNLIMHPGAPILPHIQSINILFAKIRRFWLTQILKSRYCSSSVRLQFLTARTGGGCRFNSDPCWRAVREHFSLKDTGKR